jgi:hypothetical protein
LDLELDLGAGLVLGGGGLAEGGSPPPPAAKAGTDGGEAIKATENSASVASLIFNMRTSGFPARANPRASRRYRPRRAASIPARSRGNVCTLRQAGRMTAIRI